MHAHVALAAFNSLPWPGDMEAKLSVTSRAVALSLTRDDLELHEISLVSRLMALLEAGSIEEFRQHALLFRQHAERLRQPVLLAHSCIHTAALAQLSGRVGDVEQAAFECRRIAERVQDPGLLMSAGALMTVTRIEQGRAAEIVDMVRQTSIQLKESPGWRALLAYVLLKATQPDDARATFRAFIDQLTIPVNHNWPACMAWLAELAFYLDQKDAARPLYDRLLPFGGRFVVVGAAAGCLGSVERHLGLLAAASGRLDVAQQHLEAALAANESAGATLAAAYTKLDLATVLERNGGNADHARIEALRTNARCFAESMGLGQLEREALGTPIRSAV